jgi:serine/threonine protein kinase
VFDSSCGFGLSFTHRDRIYPERRAYFRNEKLAGEWVDLLRYYRGESIHEKYTIGGKIGTGKFSVVYKCKHNFELKEYAVKEIATFKLDP